MWLRLMGPQADVHAPRLVLQGPIVPERGKGRPTQAPGMKCIDLFCDARD